MERVFRAIAVTICGWIYPLIPPLYEVFYDLAGARYFTDSTMNDLASNLYILVSVVMLFTFAVQLIKAIVNPDLLTDKQKGMGNVFKRSIIAMILIVGVPIAFNEIYKMQGQVLENHLIEKIVVGFNSGDTKPGDTNVGQVLAASTIVDLLYPVEGASTTSSNLPTYYNDMITKDIKNIDKVGLYINERYSPSGDEITDDDPYVFEFKPLVAIVAGALVLYFMVIFSMDMGVRLLKLALLELTAPISIMAYIYGGDDNLKRWTKEVGTTFLEVYVKIGIIAFIIFILNNIDSFGTKVQSNHPWMIKLFILIGLFTLAGKLPELIKMLFGITYTPKGGIGGRLGAMVGPVGKIAQGGWDKVKKGAGTVALGVGGVGAAVGALGVPGAIGAGVGIGLAHHGWNKGFKSLGARAGKDTAVGRGLRATGAFLGSGNPIKGSQEARKILNESPTGKQIKAQRAVQQKQQMQKQFDSAVGLQTDGKLVTQDMASARAGVATFQSMVDGDTMLNRNEKLALDTKFKADNYNSVVQKLNSQGTKIKEIMNREREMTTDQATRNRIDDLSRAFTMGNLSGEQLAGKLTEMANKNQISHAAKDSILNELKGMRETIRNNSTTQALSLNEKGEVCSLGDLITNTDSTGMSFNLNKLGAEANKSELNATTVQQQYDAIKQNATDDNQNRMSAYENTAKSLNTEYANMSKKIKK